MKLYSIFNKISNIIILSMFTFVLVPAFATNSDPTELARKTVASKAYVDTKQDQIETGMIDFDMDTGAPYALPALVSYDTDNGLVGNQIGIFDWQTSDDMMGPLYYYNDAVMRDFPDLDMDKFVPTVRAVANSFTDFKYNMDKISWNSNTQNLINAYNTNFGGNGNWPEEYDDSNYLVSGYVFINSLALKQNKIGATTTAHTYDATNRPTADGSVITTTTTAGVVGERGIATAPTYDANNQLSNSSWIPTMGAMMTAIANGSAALIPAGTAGNVVTYSGTAGTFGSNTVASAPSYDATTGALENGSEIANIAAIDTRQKKMTCAGWDSETHDDAHCWLWALE
ncbi:MAG: hypothetical protein J6Y07_00895 [Alphaproteobacteria bacterium]|nr:hypothetical protein [Alphaproteobacteria bacterium]